MEKPTRTKSVDRGKPLPEAPPDPEAETSPTKLPPTPTIVIESQPEIPVHRKDSDPFTLIASYKEREKAFLTDLNDTVQRCTTRQQQQPSPASTRESIYNDDSGLGNKGSDWDSDEPGIEITQDVLAKECDEFIAPLINRTGPSVSVALSTKGALDQLDSLHKLVGQFLNLQEQNLRMTRATKSTNTLFGLKLIQNQIKEDPEKFVRNNIHDEQSELDFDAEVEQNMALLQQILSAGDTASKKRESVKRERSKSALAEEILSDAPRNYPLRRQSAIVDFKPKVSKWTKVKAAFKWEKANALPDDMHSTSSKVTGVGGKCKEISPVNTEVARYLRVPSIPCTAASSGDSVISSSSRDMGFGQSPDYPSTDSSGDEMDNKLTTTTTTTKEQSKSLQKRNSTEDTTKRSRSLDSDQTLSTNVAKQLEKAKSKSAWSKVKGMVKTHRTSLKTVSRSSTSNQMSLEGSRDVSPCESIDLGITPYDMERNDSFSSSQTSPGLRNPTPTFMITNPASDSGNHSTSTGIPAPDELPRPPLRPVRKNKHIPEIQSLPEGETLMNAPSPLTRKLGPPSPLHLKRDSSDVEIYESLSSPSNVPITRPATLSMPNSPIKSFDFFMDLESGEASSVDYSESSTPQRRLSDKSRSLLKQREEIQNKYAELKKKLQIEFEAKQMEWDKIRPVLSTSPVHNLFKDDLKQSTVRPVVEEDLPADFKKKLDEWRSKKGHQSFKESSPALSRESTKETVTKPVQTKLPGQGLAILPNAKDLPEDFQKKLSEWKQLKATNKVPSYSTQSSTSGDSLKRNSLKKQITKTTSSVYGAVRKSRTTDDIEKHKMESLSKLKALVTTEIPKKEVVVQTTKGVMKFEGISRKFTRKLYEWEKSRGIGPEASTFALLHPGYQPVVVESESNVTKEIKREKSPTIQRSFSCDSISPNVSHPSISHQPSSLSLNDMDDLKEQIPRNDRKSLSQPHVEPHSELEEEPEAVIVEVEEDLEYLPGLAKSPGISSDEAYAGQDEDFFSIQITIEAVKSVSFLSAKCNEIVIKLDIKQMRQSLQALIDCLPKMSVFMTQRTVPLQLIKQLSYEIIRLLNDLVEHIDERKEIEPKINAINERFNSLKEILDKVYLQKETKTSPTMVEVKKQKRIPQLSITPVYGAHAISTVESNAKSKAMVCVTPTYVCTEIKFSALSNERKSSDRDLDSGTSQPQSSSLESETKENRKKLERNLSTGSRRKVRLRRMGSRQNSKTEESASSEDEAMNIVLEAPRKVKRKTSKCKKNDEQLLPDTPIAGCTTPTEDVVYVVKLKPTLASETEVTYDFKTTASNEGHIELISDSNQTEMTPGPLTASVLIKTKRKIFSPINKTSSGEITAVAGIELESHTTEDEKLSIKPTKEQTIKKPPLPQSPRLQEQRKISTNKEMAPNIRLMISKYNNKLTSDTKSPEVSSWQSPILDRRVQKQAAVFQGGFTSLSKSNSAGNVKPTKMSPLPITKIQKSHSSKECFIKEQPVMVEKARLDNSSSSKELESEAYFDAKESFDDYYDTVLSYDTLKKKLMKDLEAQKTVCDDISKLADDVEKSWLEQRQKDTSKGAIKKIPKAQTTPTNVNPKIFRKHDHNRPILHTSISVSPDCTYPDVTNKPPKSPLSQRAEKLKKAKEDFLQMSVVIPTDTDFDLKKHNRLSQISTATCSSIDEPFIRKSKSNDSSNLPDTVSVDRHSSPMQGSHDFEYTRDNRSESSGSRFNLSNLASKFRQIKLRKNSKELPGREGAISALCRQSLKADITGESSKAEVTSVSSRSSLNEGINVKKSVSSHILSRIFRPSREKLKKSRSLGLLVNIDDNKRKQSK